MAVIDNEERPINWAAERCDNLRRFENYYSCDGNNPGWAHNLKTTSAQLCCIGQLPHDLTGKRVLHVGIGNSDLAKELVPRGAHVVGITVLSIELEVGEALALEGYEPSLANKNDRESLRRLGGSFNFIIDPHITGYACCEGHLKDMFEGYLEALAPGGKLITAIGGLKYTMIGNEGRNDFDIKKYWKGKEQELLEFGAQFKPEDLRGLEGHLPIWIQEVGGTALITKR